MTTLVFAGQDSTSAGICTALYELASHPDAQERLRAEVTEARSAVAGGEVAYDDLDNLPFLDAVCRETLRLWVSVRSTAGRALTIFHLGTHQYTCFIGRTYCVYGAPMIKTLMIEHPSGPNVTSFCRCQNQYSQLMALHYFIQYPSREIKT